jgi:DNA-binding PadR family transcriptional regulator
MTATRLLILGAVRIFQPIHGYDLRRELKTWHADEWANISYGSIYFALKKMTEDLLLEEVDTGRSGGRPEKTRYRLTSDGEAEFQSLLREFWWERKPMIDPFMVALSQGPALAKPEIVAALRHRASNARAAAERMKFQAEARLGVEVSEGERLPMRLVAEMFHLTAARVIAEADWAEDLAGRIESGAFEFPDRPYPPGAGSPRYGGKSEGP